MGNTIYSSNSSLAMPTVVNVGNVGNLAIISPFPSVVTDWSDRVVANGGTVPSNETIAAMSTFYNGLVSDGLVSKMIAVNCFVSDSLAAAITPLIVGPGNNPWTNTNFVAGDVSVNGLLGNGPAGKFLNTGCNPSIIYSSDNDCGYSLYFSANSSNNAYGAMIIRRGGIAGIYTDPNSHLGAYTGWSVTGNTIQTGNLNFRFLSGNRTAANAAALYEASSSQFVVGGTTAGAPGARPNGDVYCFCWDDYDSVPSGNHANLFGGTSNYYSFAAIHYGLTQPQANNLFNRVQTLRQTLGGGYT
jgi:hypothetical protein